MRNFAFIALLAGSLAVAQVKKPTPQPDSKPGPCTNNPLCVPTCPANDPNGCGIFGLKK